MRVINMNTAGTHGDVNVRPFNGKLDLSKLKKRDSNCLAYGEVTGHKHAFGTTHTAPMEYTGAQLAGTSYAIYDDEATGDTYAVVEKTTPLSHEEHLTINVEPGVYKIGIAQQLDPFSKRIEQVAD